MVTSRCELLEVVVADADYDCLDLVDRAAIVGRGETLEAGEAVQKLGICELDVRKHTEPDDLEKHLLVKLRYICLNVTSDLPPCS